MAACDVDYDVEEPGVPVYLRRFQCMHPVIVPSRRDGAIGELLPARDGEAGKCGMVGQIECREEARTGSHGDAVVSGVRAIHPRAH